LWSNRAPGLCGYITLTLIMSHLLVLFFQLAVSPIVHHRLQRAQRSQGIC